MSSPDMIVFERERAPKPVRVRRPTGSPLICGFLLAPFLIVTGLIVMGCDSDPVELPDADLRDPVTGLTPAESKEVLVQVGEKKITLGDYAATLLRMDKFERLRYQTEERQKELLDEMIEVELLAQEAKRRGLDKDPQVQLRIRQALRDEVLRDLETSLPGLESFTEREVRSYYDEHRGEFKEPERRRVQVLPVATRARAEQVLQEVKGASGQAWGELSAKFSLDRNDLGVKEANELAGDRGFVSAPGVKRGNNEQISAPIRKAVFQLKKVGDVYEKVVEDEGKFTIVKMAGLSPARDRTFKDADRAIRVELRRRMFLQAEKKLEADLRKRYPVVIDKKAIDSFEPENEESSASATGK